MVRRLQLDIDEKPREEWLKLRPIDPRRVSVCLRGRRTICAAPSARA